LYNGCSAADAAEILDQHIIAGRPIRRLLVPIEAPAPSAVAAPAGRDPRTDGEGE
jgi:(2Fe-2S) ferredoxin